MKRCCNPPRPFRQQGAATLIVVMILFFIMTLVAAYTNRSLIFEQRTSANQYRSTQALEVAEAGMEWAISQLNFGRIDDACVASTSGNSFRQRYLDINASTGKITPDLNPAGGDLTSLCVWNGAGWTCHCPSTGQPSVTAPNATDVWPAFRVRFRPIRLTGSPAAPLQPSAVQVEVVGCTRLGAGASDVCLSFSGQGALNEGRAFVASVVALAGNTAGLPLAAITAQGAINIGTTVLTAYNTVSGGPGITLQSGGAITGSAMNLRSSPGSSATASIFANDPALTTGLAAATPFTTADRMFATVFKSRPVAFETQQGVIKLDCSASCSAAAVRTALSQYPGLPLWLANGPLIVNSAGDIGSAAEPAVLLIDGDLQHTTSGVNIYGLVYVRMVSPATNWTLSGEGQITGAVVTDGGMTSTALTGPTVVYDLNLLKMVRYNVGSFVRVPGSWKDFQ